MTMGSSVDIEDGDACEMFRLEDASLSVRTEIETIDSN